MPRDTKPPLIQRIARQASEAFRAGADPEHDQNQDSGTRSGRDRLVDLVSALRPADLRLPARRARALPGAPAGASPVSYMHICESQLFSMGVFLLRPGAAIPLHDHPGMSGMLKVLYGTVTVRCFDKLERSAAAPAFKPPLSAEQRPMLWRSVLRSVVQYSGSSGPGLLSPGRDNLHQITAVGGAAAFLDILAPPYDPEQGRDCHYYRLLQPEEGAAAGGQREEGEEVWLLEIPQPEDFWCGGEPYPGPPVLL